MICNACRTIETLEKMQQSSAVVTPSPTREVVLNRQEQLEELKEIYEAQQMYSLLKLMQAEAEAEKDPNYKRPEPKPEPKVDLFDAAGTVFGAIIMILFFGWLLFF
jgi:hypothetical protein